MMDTKDFFGQFFHINSHGNNKDSLFREEWNYYEFIERYQKYFKPIVSLYAYCLLPSNIHLLVRIDKREKISDLLPNEPMFWYQFNAFMGSYTKVINEAYQRSGPLITKISSMKLDYYDSSIFPLISKIHHIPEECGIVSDYKLWPFSSYFAYKCKDRRSFIAKDFFFKENSYSLIMNNVKGKYRYE